MTVRERDIENYLVKRVSAMGGEVRKVRWVGRRGAPDRLVMLPRYRDIGGGMLRFAPEDTTAWVELKAPGKTPEPHQIREHERMRKLGQRVVVIDSLAGVEELLS